MTSIDTHLARATPAMTARLATALVERKALTPCGSTLAADRWSDPRSWAEYEAARAACLTKCAIAEACLEQGRSFRSTGVFGGVFLRNGVEPRTLHFTRAVLPKKRGKRNSAKV